MATTATPTSEPSGDPTLGAATVDTADAWMLHLDRSEQSGIATMQVLNAVGFGLTAVGWGTALALADNPSTSTKITYAGSAALAVGLTATSLMIEDPDWANMVSSLGWLAHVGILADAYTLNTHDPCRSDCKRIFATDTAATVAAALYLVVMQLVNPPVWVSKHYAAYQRLPLNEQRVKFSLALLREQERRAEITNYSSLIFALALAAAYTVGAVQAESSGTRTYLGVTAATIAGIQGIIFVSNLFSSRPSVKLFAGQQPD
ncbi:MAG: hypothetical protein ABW321_27440 [Polyangiales bacterium]